MTAPTRPEVFVILTGVSGNLGDAVIRRRVLEWCRVVGSIHAYVGRTTTGWVEQLQLRPDEVVYTNAQRKLWLRRLVFGRGSRVLVFDPGEVPLGRAHLKSEIMFLFIVAALRLRGAKIVRPPRSAGDYDKLTASIYRASSRLSSVVLWRDRTSFDLLDVGELVPDTAFAEPRVEGRAREDRDTILVTMRGRRPVPAASWFEGIARFAARQGLRIVTMSQVDEDESRAAELAALFPSAEHIAWGEQTDLEHERAIRSLYESCAYVISDRLHVLILAAVAGAVPIELAPSPVPKIRTHFATIGYSGLSGDSAAMSSAEIESFLAQQVGRNVELDERLDEARQLLNARISAALPAL